MRRISELKWAQLQSIMTSFNAPFLSIFASCVNTFASVEKAFEIANNAVGDINADTISEWDDCVSWSDGYLCAFPSKISTIDSNGWKIEWRSRAGNTYIFSGGETDNGQYLYSVEYPEKGTMAALIEYIANGTPIPEKCFDGYPYADSILAHHMRPAPHPKPEIAQRKPRVDSKKSRTRD